MLNGISYSFEALKLSPRAHVNLRKWLFCATVRLRQPARASFSGVVVDHNVEIAEFSVTQILREIKMGNLESQNLSLSQIERL